MLAIALVAALVYMVLGHAYGPVILSAVVGIYTAVMSGHRWAAWIGTALLYAVHMTYRAVAGDSPPEALDLIAVGA